MVTVKNHLPCPDYSLSSCSFMPLHTLFVCMFWLVEKLRFSLKLKVFLFFFIVFMVYSHKQWEPSVFHHSLSSYLRPLGALSGGCWSPGVSCPSSGRDGKAADL